MVGRKIKTKIFFLEKRKEDKKKGIWLEKQKELKRRRWAGSNPSSVTHRSEWEYH